MNARYYSLLALLSLVCAAWSCCKHCGENKEPSTTPANTAQTAAIAQNKTASDVIEIHTQQEIDPNVCAIIKFYSPECSMCQMCAELYEEMAHSKNGKVKFYAVNTLEDSELTSLYQIRMLPTFVGLDHGKKVGVVAGFEPTQLQKILVQLAHEKVQEAEKDFVIVVTSPEQFAEEIKSGKVIAKFFSSRCGHCQRAAPIFGDFAKKHSENIKFLAIDVDVDENQELSQQYASEGVPAFYAFENGKQTGNVLGADIARLSEMIENIAKK